MRPREGKLRVPLFYYRVADGERNAAELQAIKESLVEIESSLDADNCRVFQVIGFMKTLMFETCYKIQNLNLNS